MTSAVKLNLFPHKLRAHLCGSLRVSQLFMHVLSCFHNKSYENLNPHLFMLFRLSRSV